MLNFNEYMLDREQDEIRERSKSDYSLFAKYCIRIVDKLGENVPFNHNSIQQQINDTVLHLRQQGKPVRIIVLKARQEGVSTNEQGRMLFNTVTKSNRTGLIVAHEVPATTKIFEKAKYMYNHLNDDVKPLTKASNSKELVFDRPTGYTGNDAGLNSKISIQVAGDVGIGRGDTLYYVHMSEFAFWPSPEGKEPLKQLAGIMQAVPKTPETEVVIESTANGYNDFKKLWDDAVSGAIDWTPLFFPWHVYADYQMPVNNETERHSIMNNLSEYEKKITGMYSLTAEQIKWYRWTLKNDCNNDVNMMKQENPSFPEEAFLMTGSPVFDNECVIMRINHLRQTYTDKPPIMGHFAYEWNNPEANDYIIDKFIKFIPEHNRPFEGDNKPNVIIYAKPMPGVPYVIGGDTKGEGRDFYTATVINNITGANVATIHMQSNHSKPYTWQVYCLARYYNDAVIGIEMNFNTAPIEELARLHYPRQYMRRKYDDITGTYQLKEGWKTDGNTRPLIIDKEVGYVDDDIGLYNDIDTLKEMLTFVYVDGRPDAQAGNHDDLLFSDMIGREIRPQQSYTAQAAAVEEDDDEDDIHESGGYFD